MEIKKPSSGRGPVKFGPLADFLWYSSLHGGLKTPPAGELRAVADGQVLDVPGTPRIIHVPGHTPGSIAVHVLPGHGPAWDGGSTEAIRLIRAAAA